MLMFPLRFGPALPSLAIPKRIASSQEIYPRSIASPLPPPPLPGDWSPPRGRRAAAPRTGPAAPHRGRGRRRRRASADGAGGDLHDALRGVFGHGTGRRPELRPEFGWMEVKWREKPAGAGAGAVFGG